MDLILRSALSSENADEIDRNVIGKMTFRSHLDDERESKGKNVQLTDRLDWTSAELFQNQNEWNCQNLIWEVPTSPRVEFH